MQRSKTAKIIITGNKKNIGDRDFLMSVKYALNNVFTPFLP